MSTSASSNSYSNNTIIKLHDFSWLIYLTFSVSITSDLTIAGSLSYLLSKSRTGVKKTDTVLNVLKLYFVSTGGIIACCDMASIITYTIMPHNYVFVAIFITTAKTYFWCLLTALNSRDSLRNRVANPVINLPSLVNIERRSQPSDASLYAPNNLKRNHSMAIEVSVNTETERRIDFDHKDAASADTSELTF